MGRFISEDPAGFGAGDTNLYRYVNNNPTNYTDPTGEIGQIAGGAIFGGIFGGLYALANDIQSNNFNLGTFGRVAEGAVVGAATGAVFASGIGIVAGFATAFGGAAAGAAVETAAAFGFAAKSAYDAGGEFAEGRYLTGALDVFGAFAGARQTAKGVVRDIPAAIRAQARMNTLNRIENRLDDLTNQTQMLREQLDASGGSQCFVAGTEIQTLDGEKAIEDIHVGDWVLSDDPNTPGDIEYKQVLQTFAHDTTKFVDVYIGGEKITTTEGHPFWVPDVGWVAAKDLHAGTHLQTKYESWLDVDRVVKHSDTATVYNFEVAGFHTYFVSDLGLLVHNMCSGLNPSLPDINKPFKFDGTKRYDFSIESGKTFSASLDVIDKSVVGRVAEKLPRNIDPGILEVVSSLEKQRPGIIKEIMVKIRMGKGSDLTDLDIVTERAIIQLTQSETGLGKALDKAKKHILGTEHEGKQVIGFVSDGVDSRLLPNNPRRSQNEERIAFNTIESLLDHLDSLSK